MILSIRRLDAAVETQPAQTGFERLRIASLEVIAIRKNDPMVLRQQHARVFNRIDAAHLLNLLVKDKMSEFPLLVGTDLQQDKIPQTGIIDLCVIQGLIRVFHRLRIDTLTRGCVVLNFDREVAANGLHEHTFLDRNVWMEPRAMQFAVRALPLEFALGRETKFVVTAIPKVFELLVPQEPLEHLDVVNGLADLEHHEQVRPDH